MIEAKNKRTPLQLEIQTLTPLWTGGVDGKVDRIHESGILGSLRWWYEAIVRGLGGDACDAVSSDCGFDAKKYKEREKSGLTERELLRYAGLCDVCQLFGATGWRRRFRLSVFGTRLSTDFLQQIKADHPRTRGTGTGQPSWYFQYQDEQMRKPNTPMSGSLVLHIQSLDPAFPPEVIAGLIQFVADWTAIGARAQMGFGVVQIQGDRIDTTPLYNHLLSCQGGKPYPDMPSLNNMFLARIKVKNQQLKETFNLKYDLRALFRSDDKTRHFMMGTVHGKRSVATECMAAKIKMSHPYGDGLMRVWGWVPDLPGSAAMQREEVLIEIHKHLDSNYALECWREMNSERDTWTKHQADASTFLHSLLLGEDKQP